MIDEIGPFRRLNQDSPTIKDPLLSLGFFYALSHSLSMMTSNIPARTSEDSYLFRTEPPLLSNTGERKRKRNQMTYDEDFDKNFTMNRDFKPVKTEVKKQSEPARPIDVANGSMNRQLLADYISRSTNRFGFNLSQAEMDRLYLPGNFAEINV